MIDFHKAIDNPAKYFSVPQEVVDSADLTLEEKITLLEQWRLDELEREVATEENMPSSSAPHMLRKVSLALRALRSSSAERFAPTKHGWVTPIEKQKSKKSDN